MTGKKNPYEQQTGDHTLGIEAIEYKRNVEATGIPYQSLINSI
jgi:hypothetical protein